MAPSPHSDVPLTRTRVIATQRHTESGPVGVLSVEVVAFLNTEWTLAALYVPFKDDLRLQDVKLIPVELVIDDDSEPIDVEDFTWQPDPDMLAHLRPPYGIYPRLLRLASDMLPHLYDRAWFALDHNRRQHRSEWTPMFAELIEQAPLHPDDRLTPARIDYLEVAATFARLRPQPPSRKAVAGELNLTPQLVRDRLLAARRAGFLTSPGHGRRGGSLTEVGEQLASHYLTASGRRKKRVKGQES